MSILFLPYVFTPVEIGMVALFLTYEKFFPFLIGAESHQYFNRRIIIRRNKGLRVINSQQLAYALFFSALLFLLTVISFLILQNFYVILLFIAVLINAYQNEYVRRLQAVGNIKKYSVLLSLKNSLLLFALIATFFIRFFFPDFDIDSVLFLYLVFNILLTLLAFNIDDSIKAKWSYVKLLFFNFSWIKETFKGTFAIFLAAMIEQMLPLLERQIMVDTIGLVDLGVYYQLFIVFTITQVSMDISFWSVNYKPIINIFSTSGDFDSLVQYSKKVLLAIFFNILIVIIFIATVGYISNIWSELINDNLILIVFLLLSAILSSLATLLQYFLFSKGKNKQNMIAATCALLIATGYYFMASDLTMFSIGFFLFYALVVSLRVFFVYNFFRNTRTV
jgi:O-antigen/teichoic acid export membrane protein